MVWIPHKPEWNEDPNSVHEPENKGISTDGTKWDDIRTTYDEAHPKIQDVTGTKVGVSGKPLGTKRHPPIQASVRCVLGHKDLEGKLTVRKVHRWIERRSGSALWQDRS